jgi:hypothetical protein
MLTFLPYKAAERTPRTAPAYSASRALDSIDRVKCSLDGSASKCFFSNTVRMLKAVQNMQMMWLMIIEMLFCNRSDQNQIAHP